MGHFKNAAKGRLNWVFSIIAVVAIAVFLRIYNFPSGFSFEGELGRELIYLKSLVDAGRLPTIGLTTSHEWLSYGPFYYWIMMPFYKLAGGHPFVLFWTGIAAVSAGLLANYLVVRRIAGEKLATVSSLVTALSPVLIWQTMNAKLHLFFFILIPIFMYFLHLLWQGKKKWVFWAGLIFGLMFSFHFSQIPIIGVIALMFLIKRKMYNYKHWLAFIAGTILPNITYIWQDKNIALWVPYRVLDIATKNPQGTINSFIEYFGRSIFWDNRALVLGAFLFIVLFVHFIYSQRKNLTREFLPFYLASSIGLMITASVFHGAFPIHYFLPIFPTLPIFLGYYLIKNKNAILVLFIVFLVNLPGYFSPPAAEVFVPFEKQEAIASFIVAEANGRDITIKRIGPYDFFPENYSQNYKYLVSWKGGRVTDDSHNVYTIIEDRQNKDAYVKK